MSNQRVVGGEDLGVADSDTNYYAARLASVNQDHVMLTTTDIVTANGVILVRKGVRIDSNIAERILRHKLIKPLEEQVAVADGLNGQRLAERFACLHEKYPDLGHLHDRLGSVALCNELSVKRRVPHDVVAEAHCTGA